MNPEQNITTEPQTHTQRRQSSSLFSIGLAVLLATATFFSGFHLGGGQSGTGVGSFFAQEEIHADNSIDLTEFWSVWNLLEKKFVTTGSSTLSDEERVRGAIEGLVRSYNDPYTVYLPPEEAASFEEDISGNFSGVGMEVGMRDDLVTIIAPLPGTPAEKAGLLAGDVLARIDNVPTDGMSIDEVIKRIRGEKGTEVTFTIYRKGDSELREVMVKRDVITIPTSKTETRGDVFIISLYSFNAISESEMQEALRAFVKSKKKKLILDLRGNPGGYLESAVSIGSYFLPVGKPIVRESFGDGSPERVFRSQGRELGGAAPKAMVVLVDGGSASASEILAGALQEHDAATVIGSQTFGKGSVQELIPLDDGSSLKVTIARWLTPNGVSISNGGLTPDIVVERTPEDREADKDPQLEAALDFLKKK